MSRDQRNRPRKLVQPGVHEWRRHRAVQAGQNIGFVWVCKNCECTVRVYHPWQQQEVPNDSMVRGAGVDLDCRVEQIRAVMRM